MKDLNRLLEEPGADPLEVSLLQLARSEGPSAESRRRILAGLGAGVVAGTISAPSDAAQKASHGAASSAAVKWGVAGVIAIGASVVAFLSLQPKAHTPLVVAPLSNAPSASAVPVPAPSAAVSGELVPVTKVEDLPTLADSSSADSPKNVGVPSLAEEVAAIKSAKGALAGGNAAQALRELDAYKLHFPRGRLAQEATVVRIEALMGSGNQAAAGAVADRFLAAHPDSPYSARVRTLVGR
jgi:Outer membrane lipoprotein